MSIFKKTLFLSDSALFSHVSDKKSKNVPKKAGPTSVSLFLLHFGRNETRDIFHSGLVKKNILNFRNTVDPFNVYTNDKRNELQTRSKKIKKTANNVRVVNFFVSLAHWRNTHESKSYKRKRQDRQKEREKKRKSCVSLTNPGQRVVALIFDYSQSASRVHTRVLSGFLAW